MCPRLTPIISDEECKSGSAGKTDPADGVELAVIPRDGKAEAREGARISREWFAERPSFSPCERSKIMRRAPDIMRQRAEETARVMVSGKRLVEVRGINSGMPGMNHFALALPATPFGGVLVSGLGSEGGSGACPTAMTVTQAI